jgi:hypothetical protein
MLAIAFISMKAIRFMTLLLHYTKLFSLRPSTSPQLPSHKSKANNSLGIVKYHIPTMIYIQFLCSVFCAAIQEVQKKIQKEKTRNDEVFDSIFSSVN